MGTLYENIIILCEEKGIKPGRMCAEANVSRGLITDLKMGRKSSITIDTAKKIADYFGVSVDRVLGSEAKEKSPTLERAGLEDPVTQKIYEIIDSSDQEKRKKILAAIQFLNSLEE